MKFGTTAIIMGLILVVPVYCLWIGVAVWRSSKWAQTTARVSARTCVVLMAGLLGLQVAEPYFMWHPQAEVSAKLQEGVNLSSPARTALGFACIENHLRVGLSNKKLGLSPPTSYSGGYTASVTATARNSGTGIITIVLKNIPVERFFIQRLLSVNPVAIKAGTELVYTGTCKRGTMTWAVSGNIPNAQLPVIPVTAL